MHHNTGLDSIYHSSGTIGLSANPLIKRYVYFFEMNDIHRAINGDKLYQCMNFR